VRRVFVAWNRGLGDLPLGLFALRQTLEEAIADVEVHFVSRAGLQEGFSFLAPSDRVWIASDWERGRPYDVQKTLAVLGLQLTPSDRLLCWPDPTSWVRWQIGTLIPKLSWPLLVQADSLLHDETIHWIGLQPDVETEHGPWRQWPKERWEELMARLEKISGVRVALFGQKPSPLSYQVQGSDLRGQTSLYTLLKTIEQSVAALVLPDSGILSMLYYLGHQYPLRLISLWADRQGVLKQNVPSPNRRLIHKPCIDLSRTWRQISVSSVYKELIMTVPSRSEEELPPLQGELKTGVILLSGGLGSRLSQGSPKGCLEVRGKSLFAWLIDQVPLEIPIAIMTSSRYDRAIRSYCHSFIDRGFNISFFVQEELPFLDDMGTAYPEYAPSGNGSLFRSFIEAKLDLVFLRKRIQSVMVLPIDNWKAKVLDRRVVGHHRLSQAEVTLVGMARESKLEKMGAIVEKEGKISIREYTEQDPTMYYPLSYTGISVWDLALCQRLADRDLPIHLVRKPLISNPEKLAWKQERFIFDGLQEAKRVEVVSVLKKGWYQPIKTQEDWHQCEMEGISV
jgi:GTP:adenosylcobinamide-phosphate guanylyltransferase